MRFLLDTDTVSYALRGSGQVSERLRSHRPTELAVSAISVAELRFGAYKRGSRKLHELLDTFFETIIEQPFDSAAAGRYGRIAAELYRRGEPIGMADVMIGAHALELGLVLVTHNLRHFQRIDGLEVEDWF